MTDSINAAQSAAAPSLSTPTTVSSSNQDPSTSSQPRRKRSRALASPGDDCCHVSLSDADRFDESVQAWCAELEVPSLDNVASIMAARYPGGIALHHSAQRWNNIGIPVQVRPFITTLTTRTDDGLAGEEREWPTVSLVDLDAPLPRLHTMDLGDGCVLPRFLKLDVPDDLEPRGYWGFPLLRAYSLQSAAGNQKDENDDEVEEKVEDDDATPSKLDYASSGQAMFPSLCNLSMRMLGSPGLVATIPFLGTLSHVDGALSLYFYNVGSALFDSIDLMQRHLRFPRVKTLRLRCRYLPFGDESALADSLNLWKHVEAILTALFGHLDQVWSDMESLELDLIHELDPDESLQQCLATMFPHVAWNSVLQRCPKLRSIKPWHMKGPGDQHKANITPFLYAMYAAPRASYNAYDAWLNPTPDFNDCDFKSEAEMQAERDQAKILGTARRKCFTVDLLTWAQLFSGVPSRLCCTSEAGCPYFTDVRLSTTRAWLSIDVDALDTFYFGNAVRENTTVHVSLVGTDESCLEVSRHVVSVLRRSRKYGDCATIKMNKAYEGTRFSAALAEWNQLSQEWTARRAKPDKAAEVKEKEEA